MKTKAQKQEMLDQLSKALPDATITIFTTFSRAGEQGLNVSQMQELKRSLRAQDGEYLVTKKTLLTKVLSDLEYDGIDVSGMDGSIGLVVGHGDIYAVARAAHQFAKANPSLKLFVAWHDGKAMSTEEVTEIATMPSHDELVARLLGMLNYPLKSLAIVLNQVAEAKSQEPVSQEPPATGAGSEPEKGGSESMEATAESEAPTEEKEQAVPTQ